MKYISYGTDKTYIAKENNSFETQDILSIASAASSNDNPYAYREKSDELHSCQAKIAVNLPKCYAARSNYGCRTQIDENTRTILNYFSKIIVLVFHPKWGLYTWNVHWNEYVIRHLTSQSLVWRSVRTARTQRRIQDRRAGRPPPPLKKNTGLFLLILTV